MEYLKLGENASIFHDPTTHLLIRGAEVIAVERAPKSKKFGLAKRHGHVTSATEAEYREFQETLEPSKRAKTPVVGKAKPGKKSDKAKDEEKDEYDYNPELLELTPDQFRERVAAEGFLEEDIEKFEGMSDIKKMIKLFDEVNKSYTS